MNPSKYTDMERMQARALVLDESTKHPTAVQSGVLEHALADMVLDARAERDALPCFTPMTS